MKWMEMKTNIISVRASIIIFIIVSLTAYLISKAGCLPRSYHYTILISFPCLFLKTRRGYTPNIHDCGYQPIITKGVFYDEL